MEEKLSVLLIEDDIDYASLLHLRLTRMQNRISRLPQVQIIHVHSMADADEVLREQKFDLALLDLSLPDCKELEGLARIRQQYPYLSIVVLTVTDDEETAMAAIQMGAQDYLIKDEISVSLLLRAVRYAVKRNDMLALMESKHIAQMRASEENLRAVVTQLGDGIAVIGEQNVVEFVNPALLNLLGCRQAEVIGKPFAFPIKPNQATEVELQLPNGETRILELRVSPVVWHGEGANIVVARDISVHKRASRALEQYARELEVRNEDLNAFAHTVAHNLKAPLTHVILAADLLELNTNTMNEECVPYVKTIVDYGRKMTDIIDELLLLAEVRSREDLLLLPLQMERIICDVEARLSTLIKQYDAQIIWPENRKQWPCVIGYAPWIEEVWANYLTNAIKYGGRPPVITIGSSTLNNGMVRFWVRDNGEGIPPEDHRTLFQPFARLKPYSIDGHGLGLSIVRRIIEKLGGEVGLESGLGEGSVFSFTLPAAL
ncbi:MAG: response regulator [Caldilineaceae bacterium]|nr:response regulator [Caldilineaceae bacterium]